MLICRNAEGAHGRGMGGPSSGSVYGGDHPHF